MSTLPGSAAGATPAIASAPAATVRYTGLATRAISFALDAAVINLIAAVAGVSAGLILSLLHLPHALRTVLAAVGAAAYVLWVVGYFVVFWSTTEQTPGARIMQIRVLTAEGRTPRPTQALLRCGGVLLAALPLFAGFVPVLFDDRRRGFQDRLAGTVVVEAPGVSMAEARRVRKRAAYLASSRQPRPED